ncbi:hypothetical protein K438DRAFT_1822629, partial [Mycena galopus ATCC 62051]
MKFLSETGFSFRERCFPARAHRQASRDRLFNACLWKTGRATARPFFARESTSDFEIFER